MRIAKPKTFMGFTLDKHGKFNGKPLQHWLDMAEELVMTTIIRGINPSEHNFVHTIAAERLRGLGMAINPSLLYKLMEERDRCREAIPRIIGEMLGWKSGQQFCAKHAPKKSAKRRRKKAKENRVDPLD